MWAFEGFPARLEYQPNYKNAELRRVEVFGYLLNGNLIVFRMLSPLKSEIKLFIIKEFEERFKDYSLVVDTNFQFQEPTGDG